MKYKNEIAEVNDNDYLWVFYEDICILNPFLVNFMSIKNKTIHWNQNKAYKSLYYKS